MCDTFNGNIATSKRSLYEPKAYSLIATSKRSLYEPKAYSLIATPIMTIIDQ